MEITARLTGDAKVSILKDERQVVNFNVAINDSYKTKDSELKKVTTYFQCSYWINAGIAQYLKKGSLVELYGRIGVNAYKDSEGEPKASLTFHVNNIKLHGGNKSSKEETNTVSSVAVSANDASQKDDDLPF